MARRTHITNGIIANLIACLRTWATLKSLFVGIFAIVICIICTSGVLFQEKKLSFWFWKDSVQEPPIDEVVFRSPKAFKINYGEMEEKFKVYVYKEYYFCGVDPTRYGIRYAREIYLRKTIEGSSFNAPNPVKANLFFIPIPCVQMEDAREQNDEVEISLDHFVFSHPHWNRTLGADHFYMNCNDTRVTPAEHARFLVKNSIRVACSASYNNSIHIANKDIPLPEVHEFAIPAGDSDLERRAKLAIRFGDGSNVINDLVSVRKKGRELDIIRGKEYISTQCHSTKYCICWSGDQVMGTYIALAIHCGCVPVILSDYYGLPFYGILDWSKFSVTLKEADAYRVEEILDGIPFPDYKELQANLVKVRRHLEWNSPPKKYDAFHMAMYELWLRRHVIRY